VAPAGFTLNVPRGTLSAVETAFSVIPSGKRDAWRLHRVSQGDSFAGLAKRYSAQTASISLVNHEELPEPGSLVAIPVAYPGDRAAVRTTKATGAKHHTAAPTVASALKQKKPASKVAPKTTSRKTTSNKMAAVAQRSSSKAPVRHTASLRAPNS
jgi:hypothetical protein